jgi:hypothetical protein
VDPTGRFAYVANFTSNNWTWPHDRGHMWEEISPHLSRYEVGSEPACYHAMLRLTLSRHSA